MNCRCSTSGFTLFEMMIVLALAGLLAGLAVSSGRPVSASTGARLAASEIAGALRAARGAAIAGGRPVAVVFDLGGRRYRGGGGDGEAWHGLAPGVSLALLTTAREAVTQSFGRIRFLPDGSASGGRVTIEGGGRRILVGVDWLSGRVSLENARG